MRAAVGASSGNLGAYCHKRHPRGSSAKAFVRGMRQKAWKKLKYPCAARLSEYSARRANLSALQNFAKKYVQIANCVV